MRMRPPRAPPSLLCNAGSRPPGVGLGDYRAWEHPFIVPTIVNFTGNYRALFAGFYTILRYNTQKFHKNRQPGKTMTSVLVKHLDSELSKIELKSTTKITKYHDSR